MGISLRTYHINTNRFDFRILPQALIREHHDDQLPAELQSDKHLSCAQRVVDIDDTLPKYHKGIDGPLYEA